MAGKRDYTQGTTPKGSVLFAHVFTPETYEGKEVGYTIQLKLNEIDTKAFMAVIDEELEKAKHSIKLKPGQKWSSEPFLGYREYKDGDIVFKFKTASSFTTKAGEEITRTIPVFDAHGKPIKEKINIGNGTIARVAYTLIPYWVSKVVNGIKLRLEAVQIIDLKEYGEKEAKGYGFGDEEGGFSFEDTKDKEATPFDEVEEDEGDF